MPARVRVTRPPLPLAPALRGAAERLCPQAPLERLEAVALAIAGGNVIGAHLKWPGGEQQGVETGWRVTCGAAVTGSAFADRKSTKNPLGALSASMSAPEV